MTKLIISGLDLSENIISALNSEITDREIKIVTLSNKQIIRNLNPGAIIFIIQLAQNISFSAIYDSIKHIIFSILTKSHAEMKTKSTRIEIIHNDEISILHFDFELNDEQKSKVIDTALEKFIKK